MTEIFIGMGIALAIVALAQVVRVFVDFNRRISALEAQSPRPKRHTHRTIAGIEDAMAVTIDLLIKQKADLARTQTLLEILQKVRESPHAYDPERPAGLRPEGFAD